VTESDGAAVYVETVGLDVKVSLFWYDTAPSDTNRHDRPSNPPRSPAP
jgi:hypothetical protein